MRSCWSSNTCTNNGSCLASLQPTFSMLRRWCWAYRMKQKVMDTDTILALVLWGIVVLEKPKWETATLTNLSCFHLKARRQCRRSAPTSPSSPVVMAVVAAHTVVLAVSAFFRTHLVIEAASPLTSYPFFLLCPLPASKVEYVGNCREEGGSGGGVGGSWRGRVHKAMANTKKRRLSTSCRCPEESAATRGYKVICSNSHINQTIKDSLVPLASWW